jgi:capsular polysaccharide biosynthesis protein
VISVRHWWEWNYYHFMLDVLGKLQLLDQAGLPHDIPLVVGRYALDLPWVQQILSIGTLADRPWIIQEDEFIRAEKVYYCQTREPYRVRIDHVLRNMDLPPADPGARKRIFLNRKGSTRRLMNEAEVRAILESHGFEEVFAEDYSVQEQIDLFSGVRYLVALHGAGLTNIIYRRGVPLSLLELYPDDWQSWDFAAICSSYGYGWRGIGGPSQSSRDPVHADFLIAPDQLERELARMLSVTDSLLQPV